MTSSRLPLVTVRLNATPRNPSIAGSWTFRSTISHSRCGQVFKTKSRSLYRRGVAVIVR